jgi:hypothetical protein
MPHSLKTFCVKAQALYWLDSVTVWASPGMWNLMGI